MFRHDHNYVIREVLLPPHFGQMLQTWRYSWPFLRGLGV